MGHSTLKIAGCVTRLPRHIAETIVLHMLSPLSQKKGSISGIWTEESSGVYVGYVSDAGLSSGRILGNGRGDVVLAFSGEELSDVATASPIKFRNGGWEEGPLSYLVQSYEQDATFPAGLNGKFHGLGVHRNRRTAILFNDRYGMHRLYYHESPNAFFFASEAKALLAVHPELRTLDDRSLGEFIACGAVMQDRTIFKGVRILPPASAWIFRDGVIERRNSYFNPEEWEQQDELEPETYYQELRNAFTQAVDRCFSGERPIGMSLTGGLDTRMILAIRKPDPGSLPSYTFGSTYRDNEDVRIARRVAEVCRQSHQVIIAGPEFLSKFAEYAQRTVYLTDGCVDISRSPDLYVNEKARDIAPVRMTGNYGGEILRGVVAFKPVAPAEGLFCPEFVCNLHRAAETYADVRHGHPVSFAAFRQAPWCLQGILALEQSQLSMRSPFLDNEFVRTVFRSPKSAPVNREVSLYLIERGNPALLTIPTDRGVIGSRNRLSRLISRGCLEFLFRAEYAYDLGMPQWLARLDHAAARLSLHRLFLGRHRPFHFRIWYRDFLGDYIREMLFNQRSLSSVYLQRKGVERIVQGHLRGNCNYTFEIHKLLTLELVHRLFLDSTSYPSLVAGSGGRDAKRTGRQPVVLQPS